MPGWFRTGRNTKAECPADLKQEEIQRNIVDIGHGEVGLESNEDEECS